MRTLFSNRDINRLVAHTALFNLAWNVSGAFSVVYLSRIGLSPVAIFATVGAILALRLLLRPFVPALASRIGTRGALALGTVGTAMHYPLLAFVTGPDATLVLFCVAAALSQVIYWTCYHAFFAGLGDVEWRGSHIGIRQFFGALSGIVGPVAGGIVLTTAGPFAAFAAAAVVGLVALLPLLRVSELPMVRSAPQGAYEAAGRGGLLMAADGWITNGASCAWTLVMFQAVGARYGSFGGLIGAAALAGALGGILFGRFIDRTDDGRAAWISTAVIAGCFALKAGCGSDLAAIIAVTVGTAMFGGLYIPTLLTALYHEGQVSPCPLRFQVISESGWDVGGLLACAVSAALLEWLVPLQLIITLALPAIALQGWVLAESYVERGGRKIAS